ncbi:hypothetical protein GCM10028794_26540 [Silanimonas algicola]
MTIAHSDRPLARWARPLCLATMVAAAIPAAACELDGLSHGYGPLSALFAGAHRYQSLNGLQDEAFPAEASPPLPAAVEGPGAAPPRRSFVAWAKAKPKAPGASEAPAAWVPRSADASRRAPQGAEPKQREDAQRPPGGGPVP